MRANTVPLVCHCFDFDDCLIKSNAKIKVYRNGVFFTSLTSQEMNSFQKLSGDTLDNSDFKDPRLINQAKPYKMWDFLKEINKNNKLGKSSSDIYIITGRTEYVKDTIHNFFKNKNINIPLDNIITVGNDSGEINIAEAKKEILKNLKLRYSSVYFYDDNKESIKLASEIGGIKTKLIDWKENKQNEMNEDKFISFKRGIDPMISLNIGNVGIIFNKTSKDFKENGAYSFHRYGDKNWMNIIKWLLKNNYTPMETEQVMRSKLMRYVGDNAEKYEGINLEDFLRFNNLLHKGKTQVDDFLDEDIRPYKKEYLEQTGFNEEAMGGVSSPLSTVYNTPGMGNAVPPSLSTGNIGSGDLWGNKINKKPYTQAKSKTYFKKKGKKIVKESLNGKI